MRGTGYHLDVVGVVLLREPHADLGFGRIVASEKELSNLLVNMV